MSLDFEYYSKVEQSSQHHPRGWDVIVEMKFCGIMVFHDYDCDRKITVTREEREIGRRTLLVNFNDARATSRRMANTELISRELTLVGVPSSQHEPVIAKLYQVIDEAVSPEYPILVDIEYVVVLNRGLFKIPEKTLCAICLEDLSNGYIFEDVFAITRLRCKHRYHRSCIRTWLAIYNICPLCRRSSSEFLSDEGVSRKLGLREVICLLNSEMALNPSGDGKRIAQEIQTILLPKKVVDTVLKTVVVDFQSPEICGEFSVCHFRSAVVADSIVRLLRYSGVKVRVKNHIGAWSRKFCMILQYFLAKYTEHHEAFDERVFNNLKPQVILTRTGQMLLKDREFKKAVEALHRQYLDFTVLFIKAWPLVMEFSRKEFQNIYTKLGVTLDPQEDGAHLYFHVVKYHLQDSKLISERKKDGHIFLIDENKRKLDDISSHVVEGFNHVLTDVTALWYRLKIERADWIIYITTNQKAQNDHWETVFKLAQCAGWLPVDRKLPKASHVGVGLVGESDTGETFNLIDILAEAKSVLVTHGYNPAKDWDNDSVERYMEEIASGAVKYVYLQGDSCGNDKSDFVRMLYDRKTNIYLLDHGHLCYTRNYHYKEGEGEIEFVDDVEFELGLHLMEFTEAIKAACAFLKPSLLCNYLHQLQEVFYRLSVDCQVREVFEDGCDRTSELFKRRVLLCEAATSVMRQCYDLLGIPNPREHGQPAMK